MTGIPCLPSTPVPIMNEPKQLSISNQYIRVPRLRAFNFAQVPLRCVLGIWSNSVVKINSKKCVRKSIDIQKIYSLFTTWIQTRNLLNSSQLHYRLSHRAVVFDGMLLEFSPLLCLQVAVERQLITALTRGDKLKGGQWWVFDVRQLIWWCRQSQAS